MPESCIICKAVVSEDVLLQYCVACQSALYCSKACQRKDWKKRHKQNVGRRDMQVRTDSHKSRSIHLKEAFEIGEGSLDDNEGIKHFFQLFRESAFEGSRAAALDMKIAERQTEYNQMFILFHSLDFLIRSSNSEKLSWPNSPPLVMLQLVDPSVLYGEGEEKRSTPLHLLASLADPFDYLTHVNQLILAKQLIEHGADVNAVSRPEGNTPLHWACSWANVINLDFVELLLKKGADPNFQNHSGATPLMHTIPHAPGAAKFLLNWPTADVNIAAHSGESFLSRCYPHSSWHILPHSCRDNRHTYGLRHPEKRDPHRIYRSSYSRLHFCRAIHRAANDATRLRPYFVPTNRD